MTPSVKLECLYSDTEAAKERFKRLKSEFEGHFGKSPELLFRLPAEPKSAEITQTTKTVSCFAAASIST